MRPNNVKWREFRGRVLRRIIAKSDVRKPLDPVPLVGFHTFRKHEYMTFRQRCQTSQIVFACGLYLLVRNFVIPRISVNAAKRSRSNSFPRRKVSYVRDLYAEKHAQREL